MSWRPINAERTLYRGGGRRGWSDAISRKGTRQDASDCVQTNMAALSRISMPERCASFPSEHKHTVSTEGHVATLEETARRGIAAGDFALTRLRAAKAEMQLACSAWTRTVDGQAFEVRTAQSPSTIALGVDPAPTPIPKRVWTKQAVDEAVAAAAAAAEREAAAPVLLRQEETPTRRAMRLGLILATSPALTNCAGRRALRDAGGTQSSENKAGFEGDPTYEEFNEAGSAEVTVDALPAHDGLSRLATTSEDLQCVVCAQSDPGAEDLVPPAASERSPSSAPGAVPPPPPRHDRHFRCGICLENRWMSPTTGLMPTCCGRAYCAECWGSLLARAVDEQDVAALRCPTPSCMDVVRRTLGPEVVASVTEYTGRIADRNGRMWNDLMLPQVEPPRPSSAPPVVPNTSVELSRGLAELESVTQQQVTQLDTLITKQRDPRTRRCPSPWCRQLILHAPGTPAGAPMVCECGTTFCFHHGGAHPGQTCEAYRQRLAAAPTPDVRAYRRYAQRAHTKACPVCFRGIEKTGGCSHMVCGACEARFDWSTARAEVPCACLNFFTPVGKFTLWGAQPCAGASHAATVKLVAWRGALVTFCAPVVIPYAVPALGAYCAFRLADAARHAHPKIKAALCASVAARLYPAGSFKRKFYEHGNGRASASWQTVMKCFSWKQ